MRKTLLLSLFTALSLQGFAQSAAKLSPTTRRFLQEHQAAERPEGFVYKKTGSVTYVSAMIRVSDSTQALPGIQAVGGIIGTKAGRVWTVRVPMDAVQRFTEVRGINYIQLDEPLAIPRMAVARIATNTDSVHMGNALPMPYTGKNVVVGMIDFGFDYNHPLFYDSTGSKFRLRKVWEMGGTGTPPAGFSYGREYTDTTSIKAGTTDNAKQTHGTAVAGMAIGSGYGTGTGNPLRGFAYDADAVIACVRRDSIGGQWLTGGFSDFADALKYIFDYATSVSKPCVVNISWGSQSGPHDGSSLFNEVCDNLSGPGRIIVMSAGNEGEEHIHMSKTFSAADTSLSSFVTFAPANYQRTWLDAWGDTAKTWCADAQLWRNGAPVSGKFSSCLDNGIHTSYLIGSTGDTCYLQYINSTAEFNDKPRMTLTVFNKTTDTLRVTYRATSGKMNVWNEYYYYGYDYRFQSAFSKLGVSDATEGDVNMCVSDMGSAKSVMLVGAYVTRNSWSDINGTTRTYPPSYAPLNGLAAFSSRGPLADGRIKPDITAPGISIVTSFSSYDTAYTATGTSSAFVRSMFTHPVSGRKYPIAEFSGTSAAGPAASGIIALMLQMKPRLTPAECKNAVFKTAIQDSKTGTLPPEGDNNWGHGKIDAWGAMKYLANQVGVTTYSGLRKLDCTLFPNPSNGNFSLHYSGNKAETLRLEVLNSVGALVQQHVWSVRAGDNDMPINTRGYVPGNYIVRVSGQSGTVSIKTTVQ
jgi:minor extracellular serine protease Vpr